MVVGGPFRGKIIRPIDYVFILQWHSFYLHELLLVRILWRYQRSNQNP